MVAGALDADVGHGAPVGGGGELVPAGGDGVAVVGFVGAACGELEGGGGWCGGEEVGFYGGGVCFAVVGVGCGEGGGFEGGGVGELFEAVEVGVGGVVDDFDAAGGVAQGDEEEAVGAGAVGEDGDGLDGALSGVAVPGVDVVEGVVGAEEEVA